ncbi:MAG: phenylalanine--tRNA ligase subunit beta, partial [Acidimicrobiales bacterium]
MATVGTELPNGMSIGRRKVRSVVSNGMLCSAVELGLGDDAEGILQLDRRTAAGMGVAEALGLEPDVVYDLAIEGNRPDANCMAGVARDAAARLKLPFSLPTPDVARSGPPVGSLATVAVERPDLCPRFTATAVTGVEIASSPALVQKRLVLAGMRPINNAVDASNYVMLELGQPTHPYELERLGGGGLSVRAAREGERVVTLDGVERTMTAGQDCLICDANGEPVGIGGIMGGWSTEISATTTTVLLEAAWFGPMAISGTSKRLGLRTEASARFERGCDPAGIARAVGRFCQLLEGAAVAAGMVSVDAPEHLPAPARVAVRTERVNAVLGTALTDADVAAYLAPIGFSASLVEAGVHEVAIPTFRPDSEREVDVIEEVARHHGYSRIARSLPCIAAVGGLTPRQHERRRAREVLCGAGASEAWTSSLLGPGDHERAGLAGEAIELTNPLAREESLLRTSLLPGLLGALAHNANQRNPFVRLFEVGRVFPPPAGAEGLPEERELVAVALAAEGDDAAAARRVWDVLAGALRLDGPVTEAALVAGLHPGRAA